MAERRRSVRKKSFLRGCVYFNKRRSAIDCLIRDISDQGARIIFSGTTNFPDVVELYIPHKEQTVRAHVQWRRGDEVGLAFPEAAAAPAPGRVKTLRGITAPGILRLVVTLRAKKCKNSSSAQRYNQIRFRFHTA
jgi:hypothetical protein